MKRMWFTVTLSIRSGFAGFLSSWRTCLVAALLWVAFATSAAAQIGNALDSSFNSTGTVLTNFVVNTTANAMAIQSDGKIVVAGNSTERSSPFGAPSNRIASARYNIDGTLDDSGNANPDTDFRFDPTVGRSGGYIFNLSTKGLVGSYLLNFAVGSDPQSYSVQFQVHP